MIRIQLNQEQQREVKELFRQTPDRDVRDRAQAVLLVQGGRGRKEVAADLQISPRTLRRWLQAYRDQGVAALTPGKPPGALPKIPESLAEELRGWVIQGPQSQGLGTVSWTHAQLARHLGQVHGIRVSKSTCHSFCRRHGIRPYRPTYRYLKGDPEKQAAAAQDLGRLKKGLKTAS